MHLRHHPDVREVLPAIILVIQAAVQGAILPLKIIRLQNEGNVRVDARDQFHTTRDIFFLRVTGDDRLDEDFFLPCDPQERRVLFPVRPAFRRAGQFEIHRDDIHVVDDLREVLIKDPVGLQIGTHSFFLEKWQKLSDKILLHQRLAAGQAHRMAARPQFPDLGQQVLEAVLLVMAGRVADRAGRVAPDTVYVALKKPHKDLLAAGVFAFALDGVKNFRYFRFSPHNL